MLWESFSFRRVLEKRRVMEVLWESFSFRRVLFVPSFAVSGGAWNVFANAYKNRNE